MDKLRSEAEGASVPGHMPPRRKVAAPQASPPGAHQVGEGLHKGGINPPRRCGNRRRKIESAHARQLCGARRKCALCGAWRTVAPHCGVRVQMGRKLTAHGRTGLKGLYASAEGCHAPASPQWEGGRLLRGEGCPARTIVIALVLVARAQRLRRGQCYPALAAPISNMLRSVWNV